MEVELRTPRSVSVIVPTFREVLNIPVLIERIAATRRGHDLDLELLFLDDQSRDGSVEAVAAAGLDWVKIIERTGPRGLSVAVVDGLTAATKEVVVVMDADLSHPPEKIPEMLGMLAAGHQFVLGSRYAVGGTTDDDWGFLRWLNSRVATLLARPLTSVQDPMSGFLAMWRRDVDLHSLNPTGYKIGLELLVKCRIHNAVEVPIHFVDRTLGESKLTLKQQVLYLQHLRRLYIFKFAMGTEMLHFGLVGTTGLVVNLVILTLLTEVGVNARASVAVAIALSMVSNFLLNRRLTFGYARSGNIWKQFAGFVAACSFGALVNYLCTLAIVDFWPGVAVQLAAFVGVVAGLGFNFLTNRFLVFRKRHVRAPVKAGQAALPAAEPLSARTHDVSEMR
jgi:dolichol-phosphate mannosyltransferase